MCEVAQRLIRDGKEQGEKKERLRTIQKMLQKRKN